MINAYGFDEKIDFPHNPYDGYIYLQESGNQYTRTTSTTAIKGRLLNSKLIN